MAIAATACSPDQPTGNSGAAEGVTETIRAFAENQTLEESQGLICPPQRVTSPEILATVRREEVRTGVPLFKPFPPEDRDYADFLSAYREVSVPADAITVDTAGTSAFVDVTKFDNRVFVDTGKPLRFSKVDGKWMFCDETFLSKASVTESAETYLKQARSHR
ncbi:hypothetical protein [Gordonia sp. NPDC003422]